MHDIAAARSALFAIDPSLPRERWHEVGRAAISAGLGVDDLIEWSRPAANFKSESDIRSSFRSITPDGKTGPGTLYYLAKQHGWANGSDSHVTNATAAIERPAVPRDVSREDAARTARRIYGEASGNPAMHPYAITKSVDLGELVRRGAWPQRKWTDALIIPLYDSSMTISSVEAINENGDKDFLRGGSVSGCFHPIGDIASAKVVVIGEGLATVAATGLPGFAAMSAGNLKAAAVSLRSINKTAKIVMLADNDVRDDGRNPGVEAAVAAAKAVGAVVAIPRLEDGRKCDFWDLWAQAGTRAVSECIEASLAEPKPANRWRDDELDLSAIANGAIPEPISLLGDNWLPQGSAVLFHGDGGVGKSRHALRLAICCASGLPWFGLDARRMDSVLYVSCEDGGDALHRRLVHGARSVGVGLDEISGRLHVLDRHRRVNTIWSERSGLSRSAHEFGRYASEIGAQLVIYDGLMDAFAGNINDPAQAKASVTAFLSILPPSCTLLLVGHVSKEASRAKLGEAAGTQGWNNSVRARWAMVADEDDGYTITLAKTNEGPQKQQIKVRWSEEDGSHVGFVMTDEARSSLERVEERRIDDVVLDCMKYCLEKGISAPIARTGPGPKAFDVLAAAPGWRDVLPDTKKGRSILQASLARLVDSEKLAIEDYPTAHRNTARRYRIGAALINASTTIQREDPSA